MKAARMWEQWRYRSRYLIGISVVMALVSAPGCGSDDDDDSSSSIVSSEDLSCASGVAAGGLCDSELVQSLSAGTVGALSIEDAFGTASGSTATHAVDEYVYRYRMTSKPNGTETTIDATGVVLLPDGATPSGGYPVIAWNHGAIGTADDCAISRNSKGRLEPLARVLASRGAIVVAVDYAGLGVADVPHYFLVKEPTGYSVLDGIVAGIELAQDKGLSVNTGKVAMVGLSQGGQASLFAHEVYEASGFSYPRKSSFTLTGVVSVAPAPIWELALWAAQVKSGTDSDLSGTVEDDEKLPGSLAAFAALYVKSAASYQSSLNMAGMLKDSEIAVVNEHVEDLCTADLAAGGYFATRTSDFATTALQAAIAVSFGGGNGSAPNAAANPTTPSAWTGGLVGYFGGAGLGITGGPTGDYNLNNFSGADDPLTYLAGADTTNGPAWKTRMESDSPAFPSGSTIPLRIFTGNLDETVAPQMTALLMQTYLGSGAQMKKADGTAYGGSDFTADLGTFASCTTSTSGVVCGYGHSGDTGALYSFDAYANWLMTQVGL